MGRALRDHSGAAHVGSTRSRRASAGAVPAGAKGRANGSARASVSVHGNPSNGARGSGAGRDCCAAPATCNVTWLAASLRSTAGARVAAGHSDS
jgi:hypothetical protein